MSLFFFAGLTGFLPLSTRAEVPNFLWLQTATGEGAESPHRIVLDDAGSSYIAGWFASTNLDFGTGIVISNAVRSAFPGNDAFIAKYNSNGVPVWAQALGGIDDDKAVSIGIDSQHNVYVTGSFASTNFQIGGVTLTNFAPSGNLSFYLAKFNPGGSLAWARASGTNTFNISPSALVVDGLGNSYVAGTFSGTNTVGSTNLISQGSTDIFFLKYDANGNLIWVQQAGGTGLEANSALALDKSGNVYLLANIRSTNVAFGNFVFSVQGTSGDQDMIVVKYNLAGTALWAKQFGGTGVDNGRSIAVDGAGNVVFAGDFLSSSLTIGTNTLNNPNGIFLITAGFVARLDSAGNPLWAKGLPGDDTVSEQEVAVDYSGNSYVAGYFVSSSLAFDANNILTNSEPGVFGSTDAFFAKYDPAGNVLWATRPLGVQVQRGFSIAVDSAANAYVTGQTDGSNVMFGNLATTNTSLDLFMAKIETDYPVLQIDRFNNSVVLSWPATKSNFAPQITSDFQSWTNLNGVTGTNNGRLLLTNTISGSKGFFRLKKN